MWSKVFATSKGGMRRWFVLVLLVCLTPVMSGCYGGFPMTKMIYKYNEDVTDNEIVRSLVMWLMLVVPIYESAWLGDVFVANVIEFFINDHLEVGDTAEADGAVYAVKPSEDGSQAMLTVSRDGQVVMQATFIRVSAGRFEVRDAEGRLAGKVMRTAKGDLVLTDAAGHTVRTLSAEKLSDLLGA